MIQYILSILTFFLFLQVAHAYETCENTGYIILFGDSRTDFADSSGGWEWHTGVAPLTNAGVATWTSQHLWAHLDGCGEDLKLKGKASFMIGGNDFLADATQYFDIFHSRAVRGNTKNKLKNNIILIRDILRAKGATPLILGNQPASPMIFSLYMKCDHKDTEGERRECRRLLKLGALHIKASSDALYQVESFLEREATYEITGQEVRCLERPFSYLPWWPWPICRVWGTGLKVANYYRLWERIDPNDLSHYLPDGIHYLPPGYHSLGKGVRKAFAHAGWVSDTSSVEEEKSDIAFEPIQEFCRTGEVDPLLGALEEVRNQDAVERQSVAMELNDILRDPEDCTIEEEAHDRLSTEVMALFFKEEGDGLNFEPISPEAYEGYEAELSGYLDRDIGSVEARIGELQSLDEAWEWSESSGRGGRRENMAAIRDAIAGHMSEYSREDQTLILQAIELRRHSLAKLEEAVLSTADMDQSPQWLLDIAFERQLLESLSGR